MSSDRHKSYVDAHQKSYEPDVRVGNSDEYFSKPLGAKSAAERAEYEEEYNDRSYRNCNLPCVMRNLGKEHHNNVARAVSYLKSGI